MKSGICFPPLDREQIWTKIQDTLVHMALEDDEQVQQQPLSDDDVDHFEHKEVDAVQGRNEASDNMFDELNDVYHAEELMRNNNNNWLNIQQQFEAVAERVIDAVIAEITLYKDEQSLHLHNADGLFSCPLRWWKSNERKYKMISKLALHLLCIPANSAPSE